jgi:hypothetical protein
VPWSGISTATRRVFCPTRLSNENPCG